VRTNEPGIRGRPQAPWHSDFLLAAKHRAKRRIRKIGAREKQHKNGRRPEAKKIAAVYKTYNSLRSCAPSLLGSHSSLDILAVSPPRHGIDRALRLRNVMPAQSRPALPRELGAIRLSAGLNQRHP